jgi:hypothetical protein
VGKLIKLLDDTGFDGASFAELRYFEGKAGSYKHTHSWIFESPNGICDLNHILSNTKTPAASGNYLYTRKSYDRAGGYPAGCGAMDSWGFGFRQHATGAKIAILPGSFYWHRLSADSYWTREEKKGENGKNAAKIVREFPGLFTEETNVFLGTAEAEKDFFKHIDNGRFKIASVPSINRQIQNISNVSPTPARPLRLHIGCGPRILKGWINIDLALEPYQNYMKYYTDKFYGPDVRGTKDEFIAMDVTKSPLPFADNSVDVIFDEDFI